MNGPFSRMARALAYFAAVGFREPADLRRVARQTGAFLLDLEFAESSPIRVLPPEVRRALGRHSVVIPPRSWLRSGNQTIDGLVYLVSIAREMDVRCIFEVGTYNGVTALTLATNVPHAIIHTLDLPRGQSPRLPLFPSDDPNLSAFVRRAYEGCEEADRIVQHLGDSAEFDFSRFHNQCDLVYIDGAHSYEYVKNDTEAAFRMVRDGGVIVWDDYWRRVSDVPRYLHTLKYENLFRLPESRLVTWFSEGAMQRMRAGRKQECISDDPGTAPGP
jgi:Methyltransferase domain